jgi:hypothetical protein
VDTEHLRRGCPASQGRPPVPEAEAERSFGREREVEELSAQFCTRRNTTGYIVFFGHEGAIDSVAVSAALRCVVSSGEDKDLPGIDNPWSRRRVSGADAALRSCPRDRAAPFG